MTFTCMVWCVEVMRDVVRRVTTQSGTMGELQAQTGLLLFACFLVKFVN